MDDLGFLHPFQHFFSLFGSLEGRNEIIKMVYIKHVLDGF